jgi:protein-S-isoprenylcysteine O-methyltransferase Ste14
LTVHAGWRAAAGRISADDGLGAGFRTQERNVCAADHELRYSAAAQLRFPLEISPPSSAPTCGSRRALEGARARIRCPQRVEQPEPRTLRFKAGLLSMLLARTFAGFTFLFAVIAGVLFGFAGTLHDGRDWWMLAVFFGCAGFITIWLWFRDKALLERRVKAGPGSESDPMQNVVQGVAGLVFLATFAVSGLDKRFCWSHAPLAVSLAGDGMIAIGFLIVFLTFRENTFTAGTIEIAEGQHVIASGPYAIVRHPMYAGALIMIVGIPLALGSWFGVIPAALLVPVIVWRLIREEAFLVAHLAGYSDYRGRVRYRLAPMFW